MKKGVLALLIVVMFLSTFSLFTQSAFAEVNVNVGINVPLPAFAFHAPPPLVVIPGTYAYVVPDVDVDIIFYQGYWYRPYRNYWYRSGSYNGPWKHIERHRVPGALFKLPPDYRHVPPGHQRMPYGQVKKDWKSWERERYWDKHGYNHEAKHAYKEEKQEQRRGGQKEHNKGGKGKYFQD